MPWTISLNIMVSTESSAKELKYVIDDFLDGLLDHTGKQITCTINDMHACTQKETTWNTDMK